MSGVVLHPEAFNDLAKIWDYIGADNPDAADETVSKILATIHRVAALPGRGHFRRDITTRPIRFLHIYDYLIAYTGEGKTVTVIAIIHGRRSPKLIASVLKDRNQ
jgi:plasmid stabilization system protein ParE